MISTPRMPMANRNLVFRGERLQLVREFLGFTQKEMADLLATSNAALSEFENGKRQPQSELVSRASFKTGFFEDFFYEPLTDPFLEMECSFRHRRATAQRAKNQVRAHASLLGIIVEALRKIFQFPAVRLLSLAAESDVEIESVAESCRLYWGLDVKAPIRQVGRALENAGIVVIASSVDTSKIDAFSRSSTRPLVFLNRGAGTWPSRWNFDLAHELGHLVMHQGMLTGSLETESSADKFASAFLLPRSGFAPEFRSKPFSWNLVFELKRRWQVSAAAVVRRGRDLGLIDENTYRRAFQYMSAKRWRANGEPFEPSFQEPELFAEAIISIRSGGREEFEYFYRNLGMSAEAFSRVTGIQVRAAGPTQLLSFPQNNGKLTVRSVVFVVAFGTLGVAGLSCLRLSRRPWF